MSSSQQTTELQAEHAAPGGERELFSSGPVVVFRWRNAPGWPVEQVSPNVSGLFGYSSEEFVSGGLPYTDLISESDLARVAEEVAQAYRKDLKSLDHRPYRIRRKDGKERWLSSHTMLIRNPDGEVTHYDGYVFDVTDGCTAAHFLRELSADLNVEHPSGVASLDDLLGHARRGVEQSLMRERALAGSEHKYSALMDQAPDAIFLVDAETGVILEANLAAARMLGRGRADIIGIRYSALYPPEKAERYRAMFADHIARGNLPAQEAEVCHAEGRRISVEIHGSVIELEGRRLALGILRDITDLKERERALRESEKRLRQANEEWAQTFDAVPDLITIMDTEFRILRANRAFSERLGKPLDRLMGQPCYICVHRKELPLEGCPHKALLADRQEHVLEVEEPSLGGYFRVSVSPLFDQHRKLRGSVHVARDITALKRAEEERVAQAEHQRDVLLREVHHRVKNHLQGLIGLLGLNRRASPNCTGAIEEAVMQVESIATVYGLQSRSAEADVSFHDMLEAIVRSAEGLSRVRMAMERRGDASVRRCVDREKAVAVALVINELLLKAVKRFNAELGDDAIQVLQDCEEDCIYLTVTNPGTLPAGFDFEASRGLGTGLELLRSILPRQGAKLVISQKNARVEAKLLLHAPLLVVSQ